MYHIEVQSCLDRIQAFIPEAKDQGIFVTSHAAKRVAQRSISEKAIIATLKYGTVIHRTGRIFLTLRKKDLAKNPELRPFHGTTLLIGDDGAILTAYTNKKSYSVIKKKPKRRCR